jgi:hypothetical protein
MRSPSKLVAGVVAAALLTGSPLTAATAQSAVTTAPAQNGWAALSVLTPVGATIPVLVVLALWLATLIYIATKSNGNGAPNSPA